MPRENSQASSSDHRVPNLAEKFKLYIQALLSVSLYRYGEIGNLIYTVGMNTMEGVVLYTMFSMAQNEMKVAAVLGVAVKYAYPGITVISSNFTSGFIDKLESAPSRRRQIAGLIRAQLGVGVGQALGGILLFCCFPPVFKYLFFASPWHNQILVALYLLHHIFDGSAQILEGRSWFKIIEISLRQGRLPELKEHFWVIYALSQNVQLILGQLFLWSSLTLTTFCHQQLTSPLVMGAAVVGLMMVVCAKFILPAAWFFNYRDLRNHPY
ncbi:MAG: hypothetical protein GXO34_00055 [Deltaproteobacteria bacterium]|nr:hypothetical protein [Deltaproteobacteria bacterium]